MRTPGLNLIWLGALAAGFYVYFGYLLFRTYRRWRARQRLVARGTMSPTKNWKIWLFPAVMIAVVLTAVICVRYDVNVPDIPKGYLFAACALVFVAYVLIRTSIVFLRRDRVVWQANSMLRKKQIDAAIDLLRQQIQTSGNSARRSLALANAFFLQGDLAGAAAAYREARELDPKFFYLVVAEAQCMHKAGRFEDALKSIAVVRESHPNEAGLAFISAKLLAAMGRDDEAKEQFRQGQEIADAARGVQKIDVYTLGKLRKECGELIEGPSVRGFPVEKS